MFVLLICILVILVILCKNNFRKTKIETFSKPLMYGRMSCPYTVKMVDALKKENAYHMFKFIDTSTKEGARRLQEAGGQGVPYFKHNDRYAVGYMKPSVLMKKLNI